jgi:hypothetical protein
MTANKPMSSSFPQQGGTFGATAPMDMVGRPSMGPRMSGRQSRKSMRRDDQINEIVDMHRIAAEEKKNIWTMSRSVSKSRWGFLQRIQKVCRSLTRTVLSSRQFKELLD